MSRKIKDWYASDVHGIYKVSQNILLLTIFFNSIKIMIIYFGTPQF